jgi:hypothetical protein
MTQHTRKLDDKDLDSIIRSAGRGVPASHKAKVMEAIRDKSIDIDRSIGREHEKEKNRGIEREFGDR